MDIFHTLTLQAALRAVSKGMLYASLLFSTALGSTRVVGYYPNWAVYDKTHVLKPDRLPYELVDEVIYAFFYVNGDGTIALSDPAVDLGPQGSLERLRSLKQTAAAKGVKLQTLFSVGGWGEGSRFFNFAVATAERRKRFAEQALDLCQRYDFDGIDLDWEFPISEEEGEHLLELVGEIYLLFRQASRPLKITIAAPGMLSSAQLIPWERLLPFVDTLHVMTYSLHGPWKDADNLVTNYQNALYPPPIGLATSCVTAVMEYYKRYFPVEKLFLGIPFFYSTYADATDGVPHSHYGSSYTGPGINPTDSSQNGTLSYREIQTALIKQKASGFWDPHSIAYSVFFPEGAVFGAGINIQVIDALCDYSRKEGFGGIMIWSLSEDTNDWQALKRIRTALSSGFPPSASEAPPQ